MRTIHRLTSAFVAGSFALSAFPVSAMGLGIDLSHSSYVDSSDHARTRNQVSAEAETSFKAGRKTQGSASTAATVTAASSLVAKNEIHNKVKADMGLHLGWYKKSGTGSTDAEIKTKLERKQSMYESVLKRTFNAVAQISLRICKLAGGEGDTVKKCLTDRRDAFKLRVTAMIDTAFSISL